MRGHDYTTLFKTAHMLKDVRLCLEEAQSAGVPFPAAAHARDLLSRRWAAATARRTTPRSSRRPRGSPDRRFVDASCTRHVQTAAEIRPKNVVDLQAIWDFRSGFVSLTASCSVAPRGRSAVQAVTSPLISQSFFHANCFQRMGCHRPRPRGRRAAPDTPQGRACREPASPSGSPTSASSCTPPSTTRPATSCASPTSRSCAARSRRASGATASRRCTPSSPAPRCSSPTACASARGPRSPTTSRSSTRAAWTRSRRSTCGRPTTPKSASAGAGSQPLHVLLLRTYRIPRPVTVKVKDEYTGPHAWVELQRELPFEGTRCSPTPSSSAPPRRSARSRSEAAGQPVLA